MARLMLCALVLLVDSGLQKQTMVLSQKNKDPVFLKKQLELMSFFSYPHEPLIIKEHKEIAATWDIMNNIDQYKNATAVNMFTKQMAKGFLPRGVPFSILNPSHKTEASILFNVIYSAKNYSTFYKTAAYLKKFINEDIFVYVLSLAILRHPDTKGIYIPKIYETFPSYFNTGEIMNTAQRINVQGKYNVEYYPSTYVSDNGIVIKWNDTIWPYYGLEEEVSYFTQDDLLNAYYYDFHLSNPFWLGAGEQPEVKINRGKWFRFVHKQLLNRYYMERLSMGLGEIPELDLDVVEQGFISGLLYHNGIPFPARPTYFRLNQPRFVDELNKIKEYESRINNVIKTGYYKSTTGELIKLRGNPNAVDILGNLIEANVNSPNTDYYKDFISIWKSVLGNSYSNEHTVYYRNNQPLIVPSVLEHYQTSLYDPAFYMIFKRVMKFFTLWENNLPPYKPKDIGLSSVAIQSVEVDELVTFFENTFINVDNDLYYDYIDTETPQPQPNNTVMVRQPRLNNRYFQVRINVKSDEDFNPIITLFLAPKYGSNDREIPLQLNYNNFILVDQFQYKLTRGDNVIIRNSTENTFTVDDWPSNYEVYQKAKDGNEQFILNQTNKFNGFPQRFLLPRGRIGGMVFKLAVVISESNKTENDTSKSLIDVELGLGTGGIINTTKESDSEAQRHARDYLDFPFNRPMDEDLIKGLKNIVIQDVIIKHKPTPGIIVPFTER